MANRTTGGGQRAAAPAHQWSNTSVVEESGDDAIDSASSSGSDAAAAAASASDRALLLQRAHAQARQAGLVADDSSALSNMPQQQKEIHARAQQLLCHASYHRQLLGHPAAGAASRNAELKQVEQALTELLGKDDAKYLLEHCELILASAELDAYCRQQLELAHQRIPYTPLSKAVAWDFAAGACAFLLCFGPGTFVSKFYGLPWLSALVHPVTWTLVERLLPLIRMRTWKSESADVIYPKMTRMGSRALQDATAACCGAVEYQSKKFHSPDQDSYERTLTAAQVWQQMGGARAFARAWKRKMLTDDLPYFNYSAAYAVRNSLWDAFAPGKAFRKTLLARTLNGLTHCGAGMIAGACTMVAMQQAREAQAKALLGARYREAEKLTETPAIQLRKKAMLDAKAKLLARQLADTRDAAQLLQLQHLLEATNQQSMDADRRRTWLRLIALEVAAGFQPKWAQGYAALQFRGEVPGKLYDTFVAFFAKASCLLQSVLIASLSDRFTVDPETDGAWTMIWKNCVTAFLLILWFGFDARNEWNLFYRCLFGLLSGLVLHLLCYCRDSREDEMPSVVTDLENMPKLRAAHSFKSLPTLPSITPPRNGSAPSSASASHSNDDGDEEGFAANGGNSPYLPHRNGSATGILIDGSRDDESDEDGDSEDASDGAPANGAAHRNGAETG
jgi:hypothetical protein